ncbi:Non-specific serine/threonine protein kinase [Bertholletia excelsa]
MHSGYNRDTVKSPRRHMFNCGDEGAGSADPPHGFCRQFSLAEMQAATDNFDDTLLIGKGGFGKVYKGFIDGGAATVAIKRLNAESKQGAEEFWAEVKALSKLRHPHLVSLVGYADEFQEMILVYDYLVNGNLADHLYKFSRKGMEVDNLTWEQRLNICIGAARGLDYLHTNNKQSVIHRDVKSTNILLDDNWMPRISDFGLSKISITSHSQSHISTEVRGTFGYLDPEYFLTRRLTMKSDVYAFGVVLLEVLCGRPAVDLRYDDDDDRSSLALWAQRCIKKGALNKIVDPSLKGQISPYSLKLFGEIAGKCIHSHPRGRPTMAEVVGSLELVLASEQNPPQCKEMITKLVSSISRLVAKGIQVMGQSKWREHYPKTELPLYLKKDPFADIDLKLFRHFSLSEIRVATNNFYEQQIVGHNSYCNVYKGFINEENLEVAVKRWKGEASKRELELFKVEVQHNLYTVKKDSLPWKKRLEIGIGVARGLHYLHSGTKQTIIHQNLNASSILLDENWVAKVSGLEFSTMMPTNVSITGPKNLVQCKVGYLDPEYIESGMLTIKSDVYSFGVILLELLCGRKPMIISQDEDEVNLVRWFKTNLEMGMVDEIFDPCLTDKIAPECLSEYVKIVANCVKDEGVERPTIEDVLGSLKYALQLQQNWEYFKELV